MRQAAGTAQRTIVDDNRNTIARETNVKLSPIRSNRERLTKRRSGIFRRDRGRAAMTNDQRPTIQIVLLCLFVSNPDRD